MRTDLDTAKVGRDHGTGLSEQDKTAIVTIFNRWIGEAVELSETARHTFAINIITWQIVRDEFNVEEVLDKVRGQIDRARERS